MAHHNRMLGVQLLIRVLSLIFIIGFSSNTLAEEPQGFTFKPMGATGGIARYPNSNQDLDDGNAFAEVWIKPDLEIYRHNDTRIKAFILANYVRDSKPFVYNNNRKEGIGLSASTRIGNHLEVIASIRRDWYRELETSNKLQGTRYFLNYYYYKYWPAQGDSELFGMPKQATIFKSYGGIEYPGSLLEEDDNIVVPLGGEYSADYRIGDTDFLFVPFADLDFSWDADKNNYNNKFIPSIGLKVRRPIEKGEFFMGVKYEVDYRWVDETIDHGPKIVAGWYKGF